jgi:hypothetical protein
MIFESSGLKVQYELRPHKQVERRMLIDGFQYLTQAGFPIRDYKYLGFGSFYFVDFIMFHKLLGISRMMSIEGASQHENRVIFNRPFKFVEVHIGEAADVLSNLDMAQKFVVWLDYDSVLHSDILSDIRTTITRLSVGSILLITVDVEPPGAESDGPEQWRAHFLDEAREYLPATVDDSFFSRSNLWNVNLTALARAIKRGIAPRTPITFEPLFSFLYADGHEMLSIGGMVAGPHERAQLTECQIQTAQYYKADFESQPYRIKVPNLTRKERLYLDREMPSDPMWTPSEFDLPVGDLEAYREIYRFFPPFAELLL